jgi:hypothetical protein
VKTAAWESLSGLDVSIPKPVPHYGPWPEPDPNVVFISTGPGGATDHGLPWCDEAGRYSIDGERWFEADWSVAEHEPVPAGFPEEGLQLIQGTGTQTFLRVDDGWVMGSSGFEGQGFLTHVSDAGERTHIEEPFTSVSGIVLVGDSMFTYSSWLAEVNRDGERRWTSDLLLRLPSYTRAHAVSPDGYLLLSDGANDYAIVENRIVPLMCEMIFENSYFDER